MRNLFTGNCKYTYIRDRNDKFYITLKALQRRNSSQTASTTKSSILQIQNTASHDPLRRLYIRKFSHTLRS